MHFEIAKYYAVTESQLIAVLGRNHHTHPGCSGYVIGPDDLGRITQISAHKTVFHAKTEANRLNEETR